jgi:hypothetical protein
MTIRLPVAIADSTCSTPPTWAIGAREAVRSSGCSIMLAQNVWDVASNP